MKKWLGEFLNKIRFGKTAPAPVKSEDDIIVANIARDKVGRWVTDDKGQFVYKSDTPERIAKFTKEQEKYYDDWAKKFEEQIKSKCCGGSGVDCHCSPEKLAEKKKQSEAPKPKPVPKPTATPKKKSTGGGSAKPNKIQ